MENTKTTVRSAGPTEYDSKVYRFGQISTIILLILLFCVPLSMSLIWNIRVDIGAVAPAFFTLFAMFLMIGITQIFSFTPILGTGGTFLSHNNGNDLNLTVPAAINALKIAGYEAGTPRGNIVALIAVSTAVIVSKIIIFLGMAGISFILPILEAPVLQPAFENFMPALLGALIMPFFRKDWKTAIVPAAAVAVATLIIGYPTMSSIAPFAIPVVGAIAVWRKYVLYKAEQAASGDK